MTSITHGGEVMMENNTCVKNVVVSVTKRDVPETRNHSTPKNARQNVTRYGRDASDPRRRDKENPVRIVATLPESVLGLPQALRHRQGNATTPHLLSQERQAVQRLSQSSGILQIPETPRPETSNAIYVPLQGLSLLPPPHTEIQ